MKALLQTEPPAEGSPVPSEVAVPGPRQLVRFEPAMSWQRLHASLSRQEWFASALWLLLDMAAWGAIYSTAAFIRVDASYDESLSLVRIEAFSLVVIALTLFVVGGYDRRTDMCSLSHTSEHLIAIFVAAGLTSLMIYTVAAFDQSMRPSRGVLLASFAAFGPLSLTYRRLVSRKLAAQTALKTFLVVGTGEGARRFYRAYQTSPNRERLRFVTFDEQGVGLSLDGADSPVVEGNLRAHLHGVSPAESSGVILAEDPRQLPPGLIEQLVRLHFQHVPVYTLESFYEAHWRRVPIHAIEPAWALQMGFQLARDSVYAQLKRLIDVFVSASVLLLLSPLLLFIAGLVGVDSGWPVLFRQVRVGRDHRVFDILKFRSMRHAPGGTAAAEPKEGDLYTRPGDTRITRVGRWLRKLRLDEFPQLWNVLRGDMSLIGPRAEWDKLAGRYETAIPGYNLRHLVKPGITGWAQVNYPYGASQEDAVQKLKYDLYYIRHYSLKLDAMIVLKTLHVMLFGKGQ